MDEDAKSSKAKFKSKWNRVFKEKEEHEQNPKHTNSFKLDEDVTAFLKPSTDRAAAYGGGTRPGMPPAPKLDIAIAQRWPDAHEVRRSSANTPGPLGSALWTPNGFTKPRRSKGLSVGFVKTVPEIIGEGGEEAEEPPSEIGRRRAMLVRSSSDRRAVEGAPRGRLVGGKEEGIAEGNEEEFVPGPLKRAHTSHNEVSVPLQKKTSPPLEEAVPARFTLTRTPTGLGSQEEHQAADHGKEEREHASNVPRIDTAFAWEQKNAGPMSSTSSVYSASPKDPLALAVRKRELRSSEGMALRRVSALIMEDADDGDEEQKRQSLGFGVQLSEKHYDTLSRPDAPDLLPEPRSAVSPRSARSPLGRSPFDDPKYTAKQGSRDVTPEETRQPPPPPPTQSFPTAATTVSAQLYACCRAATTAAAATSRTSPSTATSTGNRCLHSNLCSNNHPFNSPQYLPYPEYNHPQYNHPQNHRELSSRATCALRSDLSTTLRRPDRHRLLQKACLHPHSNREVEIHLQCAIASSAPMLRLRQAVPSTHDQTARVGV